MKEKTGSETTWIIFSVVLVIAPVILAFIVSSIVNGRPSTPSENLDAIILIVFSIACSLLSISWQVKGQQNDKNKNEKQKDEEQKSKKGKNRRQKNDRYINMVFYFSLLIWFISWSSYIISLTTTITNFAKIMLIISFIIIIVLSYLGIKISKKSDENENQIIYSMHDNCNKIRTELISANCNKQLEILMTYKNDLLCNPGEFHRMEIIFKNNNEDVNNE